MAEEFELETGARKRGARMTARDIAILAGREGGREGAHAALIPLGIDINDTKSIERWHRERAFVQDSMKQRADFGRTVRKVLTTALVMTGFGGFGAWLKSHFNF